MLWEVPLPGPGNSTPIVWHGSAGVHAYDLEGKRLWQVDLGRFEHIWGTGSSPLLYDDLVILNCGPGLRAFVVALDKRTGKEVWRREPDGIVSKKVGDFHGSWSTPVVARGADSDLILLSLPTRLHAVHPRTGEDVWTSGGLGKLIYTSPMANDEIVVSMSGYHGPAIAVRRGGRQDVTTTLTRGSLAFSQGRVFQRTYEHLYCFGTL